MNDATNQETQALTIDQERLKWRELDAQRLEQIRALEERVDKATAVLAELTERAEKAEREKPQITFSGVLGFSWEPDRTTLDAIAAYAGKVREEVLAECKKHVGSVLSGAREAGVLDSWLWHNLDYRFNRYGEQHGHPAEDAYRAAKWDMSTRPVYPGWREAAEKAESRAERAEEERAQVGRELEAALDRLSEQDDLLAASAERCDKLQHELELAQAVDRLAGVEAVTKERDEARAGANHLGQQLMQAHAQLVEMERRVLKAEGWAEGNANALVNVSGQLGLARRELEQARTAQAGGGST